MAGTSRSKSTGNFGGLNPSHSIELWLRDRTLRTTQLVSRLTGVNGATADNGPTSQGSGGASVSADGRYVVFDSSAINLAGSTRTTRCTGSATAPDPGGGPNLNGSPDDVFLRDMVAGTTKLISHAAGSPATIGNDFSTDPRISADGSTITFASAATNISSEAQTNPSCQYQIVAYQVATDTATIVSRATTVGVVLGAEGNATADSLGPMNSTGSIIAFSSVASNLTVDSPSGGISEVYVRDLSTGITTLESRATGAAGAVANNGCSHPTVSSDGHLVAFSCESTNLNAATSSGNENVYIRDRTANTTTLESYETSGGPTASTSASSPVMSADGSVVIYESEDATANGSGSTQVMATDVVSGTNTILSRASGSTGALGDSGTTDIATNVDGSVVAFESAATNLTSDTPPGGGTHAFVRGFVQPLPTPTPTAIPVPSVGAGLGTAGGWSVGWLAFFGGLVVTAGAALVGRRRVDHTGSPPTAP